MAFFWVTNESRAPYVKRSERVKPDSAVSAVARISAASSETAEISALQSPQGAEESKAAANPYFQLDEEQKPRKPAPRASEVMTKGLVTLSPEDTLGQAWNLVSRRRFRHIPIVNKEKVPVGIISDRDVLNEGSLIVQGVMLEERDALLKRKVSSIMKKRLLSASPDTSIREIAKVMFDERVGSMLIVDEKRKLLGIVTRSDILRVLTNNAPLELWV